MKGLDEQELRFMLTRGCVEKRVVEKIFGRRLLIIGCSKRKRCGRASRAAFDRYDGQVYRSIKKLQRAGSFPKDVDIRICSAKFGVISPTKRIKDYDKKMTQADAARQLPGNLSHLKRVCKKVRYREIFVCMGKEYRQAIGDEKLWNISRANFKIAEGKSGQQCKALKKWLLDKGHKASR